MSPTPIMRVAALSLLLISLGFVACAPKAKPLNVKSAIVDNAELFIASNDESFKASKMGAKFIEFVKTSLPQDAQQDKEEFDALVKAAGLGEGDVKMYLISVANLESFTPKAPGDAEAETAAPKFLLGAHFAKPVNIETLFAYLSGKAKEADSEITREEYAGVPLFVGKFPVNGSEPSPIALALKNAETESLLIIGDDASVRAAVTRANENKNGDLSKFGKAVASMDAGAQVCAAYILSEQAQGQLKAMVPMFGMLGLPSDAGQAIASLTEVNLEVNSKDVINVDLELTVGSSEFAKSLESVLSSMLISAAKMGAQKKFNSVPNMVESLAAKATESKVSLSTNLNETDLDLLKEEAAKAK